MQRNKYGCANRARVTVSDPGYQVSHETTVTRQKRGNVHRQFEHGASTSITYNTQHSFTGVVSRVIPLKRALSEWIEFGGRGTRVEGEVVVQGVVVGSSGSRDGSRT